MKRRVLTASPSRRELLYHSGMELGAIALSVLLHQERAKAGELAPRPGQHAGRAKSCIFLLMESGPSHIDTLDPKTKLADLHTTEFVKECNKFEAWTWFRLAGSTCSSDCSTLVLASPAASARHSLADHRLSVHRRFRRRALGVPSAVIELHSVSMDAPADSAEVGPATAETDELGPYRFDDVAEGCYFLSDPPLA